MTGNTEHPRHEELPQPGADRAQVATQKVPAQRQSRCWQRCGPVLGHRTRFATAEEPGVQEEEVVVRWGDGQGMDGDGTQQHHSYMDAQEQPGKGLWPQIGRELQNPKYGGISLDCIRRGCCWVLTGLKPTEPPCHNQLTPQ